MTNTKDNNQLATKKDLQSLFQRIETRFETKGELKKTEKNLRTEILKVEEKVETIQEQQQQIAQSYAELQDASRAGPVIPPMPLTIFDDPAMLDLGLEYNDVI